MTDRNIQNNSNDKTSASDSSDATQRTTYDRNSDQTLGSPKVHVSHNGYDRASLFRAPETFRRSIVDGRWDGRGVPSGSTSYRPASAGGLGSGSASTQSGLACLFCGETSLLCSKYGCWKLLSSDHAKPKYNLNLTVFMGSVIALALLAGFAVVFLGVGR